MELYFGEYQHVQQGYGVHLRMATGDDSKRPRPAQHAKVGSYGVSIRVQGIDGHPYIVLNNTERCLAAASFPEDGSPFPAPVNKPSLHPNNGSAPEDSSPPELEFPENPYAPSCPAKSPKPARVPQGKTGGPGARQGAPPKPSHLLNFQKHPELLQPYDPQKLELGSPEHPPRESSCPKAFAEAGSGGRKVWARPSPAPGPPSPAAAQPAPAGVQAIRVCGSVVIEDP
ncbi:cingulin-like protein 1, partial [Erinaceus europaeus]|uniref:Cingulin-like protein 1 n=1 Tax=Erinaceus europaeus TaxID=9365 RepID=A0ABM3WUF4_ERIEU